MSYYYNIEDDLTAFPDCWCYVITGGRSIGKTYSTLKYVYQQKEPFIFIKRTDEDIKLLCSGQSIGSKIARYGVDLSPFKSLNRDMGWNVKCFSIYKGHLAGFWNCDEEGNPIGNAIGYCVSLSAVSKVKGFDFSDVTYMIFDEFIPNKYDRVSKNEGLQLLDLYKTVARDREHRGQQELKLILLANQTSISNPIFNTLELTDTVAKMQVSETEVMQDDRLILIRLVKQNEDFMAVEEQSKIMRAMRGTQWHEMSSGEGFAYDDFSNVNRNRMKRYKIRAQVKYNRHWWYLYQNDNGVYYMTHSRQDTPDQYDLEKENDQKRFYIDWITELRFACIEGNMQFEDYSMYDVIMNYKKFFDVLA